MIHIYAPQPLEKQIKRQHCPTCKRRTYFVIFHYEWHGPDMTCMCCGEKWSCGEMSPRPFMRGWREKNKATTRKYWRLLCAKT